MKFVSLAASLAAFAGFAVADLAAIRRQVQQLNSELGPSLSRSNLISMDAPPRWSQYHAPKASVVVNVETEADVVSTVQYCTANNITFLAQNGGNGWATTFNLGSNGLLINLARLDQVTFNDDKTLATIGGGSNINNTIARAYAANAIITTGNCNCVGALGAMLGGGYGNLMGINSFGVDNIVSMRVVTADGTLRTVTASSDADLFWALRGAAPNLGIVTSAVVKSKPATAADMNAWTGALIFSSDKLEQVVQAIQDTDLKPDMNVFMYFISSGPPSNTPVILVTPFLYMGTPETGRAAFASLFSIGPFVDTTKVIPYNQWNSGGDQFCSRGPRKPAYGAGFQKMIPSVWRQIWNKYVEFQKRPTAENSVVLIEAYSLTKARSVAADSTAFANRHVNFNAVAIPWYSNSSLDCHAEAFGGYVRDLWRNSADLPHDSTYINFAYGDEDLDVVYGDNLSKLRALKQRYDPSNRFNQWFNIH